MALESAASDGMLYTWSVFSSLMKFFKLGTLAFTYSPRISCLSKSSAAVDTTTKNFSKIKLFQLN
jgi:hypothetical protein